MKKIIFLFLLCVPYCKMETIAIEQIISMCCIEGEEWGTQDKPCSDYKQRLDLVPNELYGLCLSTVEICCSKQKNIYECTAGQIAAKSGSDCNRKDKKFSNIGVEYYKNCCEACKIGLVVGSSSNKCSLDPFNFGLPWDEAYHNCCGDLKTGGAFIITEDDQKDLCSRFDRLCDQICENTDESYVCRCNDGYQLLEDKRTCVRIANRIPNAADNEIPTNDSDSTDCPRGFIKNRINDSCDDINECETNVARCDAENQVCYNTEGSYNCLDIIPTSTECEDGYRYNYKTEQCQDIDECDEDSTSCDNGYTCLNTIGSFECVKRANKLPKNQAQVNQKPCEYGFLRVGNACIDVDECATDPHACDNYQICTNEIGGFRCDCKTGFILDPITNACVDINECQINNHECLESQRCDNTIGSYTCIRLQSCGTGYTLNAETGNCDDDDECLLKRHNCVLPYECRNTRGSFRCLKPRPTTVATTTRATSTRRPYQQTTKLANRESERYEEHARHELRNDLRIDSRNPNQPCTGGFERNSQGACVDINECDRPNACRRHQRCLNTNGSFRCENLLSCSGGFQPNEEGTHCVDIDECETKEANCGPDQICRNKAGGYTCMCAPGHMINQNRRCEDINECELYKDQVCPSNTECQNTIGSYRCECKSGFTKQREEDRVCIDVDECMDIPNLCHQRCINYWGSYRCACESGYRLNENNRTCDDLNECEVHKSYNLCMGTCENVPGSYVCTCPTGYRLGEDSRTCQDIDECATQNLCNGHHEICTNTRGGYRCKQIECPYGYILDSDKKNRCKRIAILCDRDDIECFIKPSSYSYNFITLTSNMSLPPQGRALFNLRGPNWYENIDFDLKVVNVNAPPDVPKANERYFYMNKMQNEVLLNLVKTLQGPQDIELDLSMTVFRDGRPSGSNVAKIFLIVSEHSF